jgi:hypothetical protein
MIIFDPLTLLFWVTLISFIPGIILAIALLKKTEFWLVEKILIGAALGLVLPSFFPFVLFLLGVSYSYQIAILCTVIFYVISIGVFIWTKSYEEIKNIDILKTINEITSVENIQKNITKYAQILALLIILYITFMIRVQTYSPIHYELDPYFYIYSPYQILTLGGSPIEDDTAWWPEAKSTHRAAPILAYMEAMWYSFYTQGGEYNNYLLAVITSLYPPLAAVFAVFFLYLFVAANYRREYALGAAGIATCLPTFITKLSAGVMEVQPYAFFALSFFLAMYAWMLREKSTKIAALAGVGYGALFLGSASGILGIATLILFIPLHSILLFVKSSGKEIKEFVILNTIVIGLGYVFGSLILGGLYTGEYGITKAVALISVLAFSFVLYIIKSKEEEKLIDKEIALYALIGILIIAVVTIAFTPIGSSIKDIATSGLNIAKYKVPLERTIAEQPPAGAAFEGSLGFLAFIPKEGDGSLIVVKPLSDMTNLLLASIYATIDSFLNVGLTYDTKASSLLLVVILFSFFAFFYSFYRSIRTSPTAFLLYAAILLPTMLVGILKLKYTIYMGFFLAGTVGVVFGEFEMMLNEIAKLLFKEKHKKIASYILLFFIALSAAFAILQFVHGGFALNTFLKAGLPRFENNPAMFKAKFTSFCGQLKTLGISEKELCQMYAQAGIYMCSPAYDEDICKVAEDPVAYANKGINEQYNKKLCYYSLMSDILKPKQEELFSAQVRCLPISDYWIETMEWIKNNTEPDARITSWWDYGHWINFFGQRNTVLRNEHASLNMIGAVAKGYVDDSPEKLAEWMKAHGSKYALFDIEINGIQGGKYGALNYLSCAYMNKTNVSKAPGESLCEYEHLWETLYVPKNPEGQECKISAVENRTGILVYGLKAEQNGDRAIVAGLSVEPRYCLENATLIDGTKIAALYYLNETYPNGDLKLNKAFLRRVGEDKNALIFIALYTNDYVWLENGEIKSGWEDRKGKYYDSAIYRAFFLEDLPGFKLVFKSKGGEVKIYKLEE